MQNQLLIFLLNDYTHFIALHACSRIQSWLSHEGMQACSKRMRLLDHLEQARTHLKRSDLGSIHYGIGFE